MRWSFLFWRDVDAPVLAFLISLMLDTYIFVAEVEMTHFGVLSLSFKYDWNF